MKNKSKTLTVRVSHEKHAQYTSHANSLSMNLSTYVKNLIESDIKGEL